MNSRRIAQRDEVSSCWKILQILKGGKRKSVYMLHNGRIVIIVSKTGGYFI